MLAQLNVIVIGLLLHGLGNACSGNFENEFSWVLVRLHGVAKTVDKVVSECSSLMTKKFQQIPREVVQ